MLALPIKPGLHNVWAHNAQVLLVGSVITRSENLVNSDWSVNLSPHEIALQQRATVVIDGIITNSDWLKSKFIAFLANQNGRKYQNKQTKRERLLGKLSGSAHSVKF